MSERSLAPSEVSGLLIADVKTDGGTQPRVQIFDHLVADYAEAMGRNERLPPPMVYFDGARYWLADGFHRLRAAQALGRKTLMCEVRQGSLRDAIIYSVGANAAHGLPRSNDDKRRAVRTMLDNEEVRIDSKTGAPWSDREIARLCRVSHPFVAELRGPQDGNVTVLGRAYVDPRTGQSTVRRMATGGRQDSYRDVEEDRPELSADEIRLVADLEKHEPTFNLIRSMAETYSRLPPAVEAAANLPKGLRLALDFTRLRAASAWLREFADACA